MSDGEFNIFLDIRYDNHYILIIVSTWLEFVVRMDMGMDMGKEMEMIVYRTVGVN